MRTVEQLVAWLGRIAPLSLAESWDNVGLLMGDPSAEVSKVMTTLTVTPTTATEAIEEGAGLIVSHHPILFKPTQSLRSDRIGTGPIWALARAGIAVYSPHTAFDNAEGGINDLIADRLGLDDRRPLRMAPARLDEDSKVVVFVPEGDRDAVLNAIFALGAGRIGNYRECSFALNGYGTFFGEDATNPTVGQSGRRETAPEQRVEVVCPTSKVPMVLEAIRSHHSYEEPAIDVYPLRSTRREPGIGRVGQLSAPTTLGELARRVGRLLEAPGTRFVGAADRTVQSIAVVCGAGGDFLEDASRSADTLITGEARYHTCVEAEARQVGLVLAGHHATERTGVEDLARRIDEAFDDLNCWASRSEGDPVKIPTPEA